MSISRAPRTAAGSGVLDRAVSVLDAVERGARSPTEVARETGLTKSTAHRLVSQLAGHGFLSFVGGQGYVLGPHLLRLATVAMRELPLRDLAHPALEALARSTGESAQLYVRSLDSRICVDAVQSASELRTIVDVGVSLPLTAGSAGKVFLAWATDADRERLLANLMPLTERTPDRASLEQQLITARQRGWAQSVGEREPAVASVSAPVIGARGTVTAAVSVSGPADRLGPQPGKTLGPIVQVAASTIERALGIAPETTAQTRGTTR